MVLFDPARRWGPRGICRVEDWPFFFANGGTPGTKPSVGVQKKWNRAKEICAVCPALAECRRDTLGEEYGVYGGRDQYERAMIRRRLSKTIARWSQEERLAWGRELKRMRDGGLSWRTVTIQTGMPQGSAEALIRFFEESVPEAEPAGVVDLPLPEGRAPLAFPARPGQRHAWVRHNRIVADAMYRGETPDGKWVFVTVHTGRGNAHKWIAREDVHLYHPQPVVIVSKRKETPDAPAPECEPAA